MRAQWHQCEYMPARRALFVLSFFHASFYDYFSLPQPEFGAESFHVFDSIIGEPCEGVELLYALFCLFYDLFLRPFEIWAAVPQYSGF